MTQLFYTVQFTGPFGYIKPWSAVRDELTYSQLYLSQSTLEGISQKLFGIGNRDSILRHRLSYDALVRTQERTLPKLVKPIKNGLPGGILNRIVMLNPILHLAFGSKEHAEAAAIQHICLCRNEDILLPIETLILSEPEFNAIPGFEYIQSSAEEGIFHGQNRYKLEGKHHAPQYGKIHQVGEAMRTGEQFAIKFNIKEDL